MEFNIRKKKWFLCGLYIPHKNNISSLLDHLNKGVDVCIIDYDNFIILGEPNSKSKDNSSNDFSNVINLKNLIKKPICFKNNPESPSCRDLFLTNCPWYFQNASTTETEITDFHDLVVTVLKLFYKRSHKSFNRGTLKLLASNYLELNWTKTQQKLI